MALPRPHPGLHGIDKLVEADPVGTAIRELVDRQGSYASLVSGLYAEITQATEVEIRRSTAWPKSPARFGEQLRQVAPALRAIGIRLAEIQMGLPRW